jgi:hypothetical protein
MDQVGQEVELLVQQDMEDLQVELQLQLFLVVVLCLQVVLDQVLQRNMMEVVGVAEEQ